MITAKVWNSEKLANYYHGKYACNTIEAINDYENNTRFNLSSKIIANSEDHLHTILNCIHNETDVILCYHIIGG